MANRVLPFRNVPGDTRVPALLGTEELPWAYGQRFGWECRIDRHNIYGAGTQQDTLITIPSSGFVSGRLTLTFANENLDADVSVYADANVEIDADDETNLGTALAAAIDAEGDLDGILDTVTDNTDGTFNLLFAAGVGRTAITITFTPAQQVEVELTGTIYDAIYRLTLTGDDLADPVVVSTPRTGGTPATIGDLADEREVNAEDLIATTLADVLATADSDGTDSNLFIFYPGLSEITITPSIVVDTEAVTQTVTDLTPAGPTVTQATTLTIDLTAISGEGGFPDNVLREYAFVNVVTAFGASRTITVGDVTEPAGLAGSTPINLNATGRSNTVAADAYYVNVPVLDFSPTATIVLGSSSAVTTGEVRIEICWYPNLRNA